MYFSNKLYDTLKWIAQFVLPGLATLYFAISGIWGLPYTEEIVGTIMGIDIFLGAVLGISTMQFQNDRFLQGDVRASGGDLLSDDTNSRFLQLSSETYEILKWVALILLPAGGTLYLALSKLWGFPYGQEVVGTIAAVTAFLGILLGVSTSQYNKSLDD